MKIIKELKKCMASACFAKGNTENIELIKKHISEHLRRNPGRTGGDGDRLDGRRPFLPVDKGIITHVP